MANADEFSGKVAFITGAASGIGRATALAFAQAGAKLILADIDAAACEKVAADIRAAGGSAIAFACDVTSEADIQAALGGGVSEFGGLDIAFNNAGANQRNGRLGDFAAEEWHQVIDVNLTSVFLCMRNELPLLLERGGGCIVNVSSGAGVIANKGGAIYGATKHAIVGLTKSAAVEYVKDNIRINVVSPGPTHSNMAVKVSGGTPEGYAAMAAPLPIGRLGEPEEIASAVLWLCSKGAAFAIGHSLVMDGGYTII